MFVPGAHHLAIRAWNTAGHKVTCLALFMLTAPSVLQRSKAQADASAAAADVDSGQAKPKASGKQSARGKRATTDSDTEMAAEDDAGDEQSPQSHDDPSTPAKRSHKGATPQKLTGLKRKRDDADDEDDASAAAADSEAGSDGKDAAANSDAGSGEAKAISKQLLDQINKCAQRA